MFCVDRAHAREQQSKFEQAGIPFGYIDGTMSIEERLPVFAQFRTGAIKGIASVGCLSRGVDEDVRYIIDAQPTNSEMNLVQKDGRGLRIREGKHLLIADHAGNMLRLGMLEDIHHDELDARLPGDKQTMANSGKAKKPHKCPKCNSIIPYGSAKCGLCGAILKAQSSTPHAPGSLAEYGKVKPKKDAPTQADKQAFYSGFLAIAAERGYSDGWASHKYKTRFGVWPKGVLKVPSEPTPEVRNYDRYLRIQYAKSKAKGGADAGS